MHQPRRREALCALLCTAGLLFTGRARADEGPSNRVMREQLKYHEPAVGKRRCATCVHFRAGMGVAGLGQCELITGDERISPAGVCGLWSDR